MTSREPAPARRVVCGALLLISLTTMSSLAVTPALARPADFQTACAALVGERAVAIVVADPRDHRLLALVHPALAEDAFPPGSIFKLVTALAALRGGLVPSGSEFDCRGCTRSTQPGPGGHPAWLRCWKAGGHGRLGLESALGASCNLYFARLGEEVGLQPLLRMARDAGLGAPPASLPRGLPAPRPGALLANYAIGEGPDLAVSPLQVSMLMAAIATGQPPVLPAWLPPAAQPGARSLAPPAQMAKLRTGLAAAVQGGSARLAACRDLAVAGKTGTAVFRDGSHRTHGWFAGYAPREHPAVVVVAFVRQGSGFREAATLGRRVFAAWLAAGRP